MDRANNAATPFVPPQPAPDAQLHEQLLIPMLVSARLAAHPPAQRHLLTLQRIPLKLRTETAKASILLPLFLVAHQASEHLTV